MEYKLKRDDLIKDILEDYSSTSAEKSMKSLREHLKRLEADVMARYAMSRFPSVYVPILAPEQIRIAEDATYEMQVICEMDIFGGCEYIKKPYPIERSAKRIFNRTALTPKLLKEDPVPSGMSRSYHHVLNKQRKSKRIK